MPRLIWFALGALAGHAYASRAIDAAHLGKAEELGAGGSTGMDVQGLREKLADRLEENAIRISGLIEERAHELAESLRGQADPVLETPKPAPAMGMPQTAPLQSVPRTPVMAAAGTTAHDVLAAPFPQIDHKKPSEHILEGDCAHEH